MVRLTGKLTGYHYDLPSPSGAYKNDINATGGYCHRADGCSVHPACGSALLIQERSSELAEAAEAGGMRALATLLVGMDWRVDQGLSGVTVQSCNGAEVLLWIPLAPEQIRVLQSATAGKVAANIVGALVQG